MGLFMRMSWNTMSESCESLKWECVWFSPSLLRYTFYHRRLSGWSGAISFCKSTITTPNHLVLHMPGNGYQDYLLHHLPTDRMEPGLHLILCIVILKAWSDHFLLPVIRSISTYHELPKVIQRIRQPIADICNDHSPASAQQSLVSPGNAQCTCSSIEVLQGCTQSCWFPRGGRSNFPHNVIPQAFPYVQMIKVGPFQA